MKSKQIAGNQKRGVAYLRAVRKLIALALRKMGECHLEEDREIFIRALNLQTRYAIYICICSSTLVCRMLAVNDSVADSLNNHLDFLVQEVWFA